MRQWLAIAVAAATLGSPIASADLPLPNKEDADFHLQLQSDGIVTKGENIGKWHTELAGILKNAPVDRAVSTLAPKYGLSAESMRELVHLWVFAQTNQANGVAERDRKELTDRYLTLIAATNRSPLVLEVAAASLLPASSCNGEVIDQLLAGSSEPVSDTWRIAQAGNCAEAYARFAAIAPDRTLPALIKIVQNGWLPLADTLALLDYLTSPAALARIDAAHREGMREFLTFEYLTLLLNAGLTDQAIDIFEALPEPARRRILRLNPFASKRGIADGLPFAVSDQTISEGPYSPNNFIVKLAAAYAVEDRPAEAEALFAELENVDAARRYLACRYAQTPRTAGQDCNKVRKAAEILLLDYHLHRKSEDPYPIAEVLWGHDGYDYSLTSVTVAELNCKVFREKIYDQICLQGRRAAARSLDRMQSNQNTPHEPTAASIVSAAKLSGYGAARNAIAREIGKIMSAGGGMGTSHDQAVDDEYDPVPPPYEVLPIPQHLRGKAAENTVWPATFTPLPKGHRPVRVVRDGNRVAAVSVTNMPDAPEGAILPDKYWFHLSDDQGKTWHEPVFTWLEGLIWHTVVADSRLPLLDGDMLNIAVDVREAEPDPAYPRERFKTHRSGKNLYLRLPIALMQRDKDGISGLTKQLLHLTPTAENRLSARPVIVGSAEAGPCRADVATTQAMKLLLEHLFGATVESIAEPPAGSPRQAGKGATGSAPRYAPDDADRPLLIAANPADFSCLRTDKLVVVYSSPADIQRLHRTTMLLGGPSITKPVFNRARDRGYIYYSEHDGMGGVTVRVRKGRKGWTLEKISEWVS